MPLWLWLWGGMIAVLKISNIIQGYIHTKQFPSFHTMMNKVMGLLLFLVPWTLPFVELKYTAIVLWCKREFMSLQIASPGQPMQVYDTDEQGRLLSVSF